MKSSRPSEILLERSCGSMHIVVRFASKGDPRDPLGAIPKDVTTA